MAITKHASQDVFRHRYITHNDEVYKRRRVHKFSVFDWNEVELYISQQISEWQDTEHGQWVMAHGLDPTYLVSQEIASMSHIVVVEAYITPKRWTEYCLRFDKMIY